MRFKIWLSIIAIVLLGVGAGRTYIYLTNLAPTESTLKDYVASKPSASWVKLTNCELDLLDALQLQSRFLKVDKGVLIPIRLPDSKPDSKAPAFLFTTGERWDQLVSALAETTQPASGDTVEGMVMGTFDRNHDKMIRLLRDKGVALHDVLIISDGAKPDSADVILFVVLIVAGILILGLALRKRSVARVTPPPLPVG